MIQFKSKAAIARFFGVPERALVEVKAGETLIYESRFPATAMNLSRTKVGRHPLQELDAARQQRPNPLK